MINLCLIGLHKYRNKYQKTVKTAIGGHILATDYVVRKCVRCGKEQTVINDIREGI